MSPIMGDRSLMCTHLSMHVYMCALARVGHGASIAQSAPHAHPALVLSRKSAAQAHPTRHLILN